MSQPFHLHMLLKEFTCSITNPTSAFTILELYNPSQDVLELYKTRGSTDFKAPKLGKGLSGIILESIAVPTQKCSQVFVRTLTSWYICTGECIPWLLFLCTRILVIVAYAVELRAFAGTSVGMFVRLCRLSLLLCVSLQNITHIFF